MEQIGYGYILASAVAGTLYVGVTSNLIKRISEHKSGAFGGFTNEWKIKLIEEKNPKWADLYPDLMRGL
jgi:putative endonuclease